MPGPILLRSSLLVHSIEEKESVMQAIIIKVIFSLVFSFLITFYLIPVCLRLAAQYNFVDVPDGKVKRHKKSTPYLGGVAIYGGFLCGIALTIPFENRIFLFLVGSTLLLFVGLIDDLLVLKPYQKFFGQLIAALCFLKAGFYLKTHIFYNFWVFPLSLFWILSIINAFNLVDIMDGLAGLIAIMATLGFLSIAILLGHQIGMILLSAFLGSVCAFFWYNRPVARIYLGDAGSLFIGGLLATVPFLFNWGTYNAYGYLASAVILTIPSLEIVSLIIIRFYKGIPFYQGSPDHFACYLQAHGWSVSLILLYILFLSFLLDLVSVLFVAGTITIGYLLVIGLFFLLSWIIVLLRATKNI